MNGYLIKHGDYNELDLIKPLWEKLNQLHAEVSPRFKKRFQSKTWEERKGDLLRKSKEILFDYAVESITGATIGYCISSIDRDDNTIGEIDSIYVDEAYRKSGIGKQLMEKAIEWLSARGTKSQKIIVVVGNEQVLNYYSQFDFFSLHIVLQRIDGRK